MKGSKERTGKPVVISLHWGSHLPKSPCGPVPLSIRSLLSLFLLDLLRCFVPTLHGLSLELADMSGSAVQVSSWLILSCRVAEDTGRSSSVPDCSFVQKLVYDYPVDSLRLLPIV